MENNQTKKLFRAKGSLSLPVIFIYLRTRS